MPTSSKGERYINKHTCSLIPKNKTDLKGKNYAVLSQKLYRKGREKDYIT